MISDSMKRWASKIFTTLPGVFLTPVLYVIFVIKLVPPLTMLCYLVMLIGIAVYSVSQYRKHRRWSKFFGAVTQASIVCIAAPSSFG
jgi:O-antigen/teichoic acid export membrane protein